MDEQQKNISQYFRNAVAAQVNAKIDFKKTPFEKCDRETFAQGILDESIFRSLLTQEELKREREKPEKKVREFDVLFICAVKPQFDGQEKVDTGIEDLTGIYYIPAKLNEDGVLRQNEQKLPWIPREFLNPMTEVELSLGEVAEYNQFLSDTRDDFLEIQEWQAFITYAEELYRTVVKQELMEDSIPGFDLHECFYIIRDNTIFAVRNVLALYDHIIAQDDALPLYEKLIALQEEPATDLIEESPMAMKQHCGQMGGEYPVSPSQRECIRHMNTLGDGEVLAVNGPPGTGKTTLLQSVVADLYVQHALAEKNAPLIVASSTNNQAVTNIIESFGKIQKINETSNFEERWVYGIKSFAVYFPSSGREKEAQRNEYQFTNPAGKNFVEVIESEENLKKSTQRLLECYHDFFGEDVETLSDVQIGLQSALQELNQAQHRILEMAKRTEELALCGKSLKQIIEQLQTKETQLEDALLGIKARIQEWEAHFSSLPFLWRIFGFLNLFKKRIEAKNRLFLHTEEDFLNCTMRLSEIEEQYSLRYEQLQKEIVKMRAQRNCLIELEKELVSATVPLHRYGVVNIFYNGEDCVCSLEKVNERLDTKVRYVAFWLAVHYYEARWANGEDALTERQKGKTFANVLQKRYHRLSMLCPCFVMTFYMLPGVFKYFESNNPDNLFLKNHIDLLIVDEAGQVSPEIAMCSFALAKRAIVVGDVWQIEPVWSVSRALDKALAMESKVIPAAAEFDRVLEVSGLNASNSSVMQVAAKSCKYMKYGNKGMFLSEHRRCYNEIIAYCNALVYHGNLEPLRGAGQNDQKYPLCWLPFFGCKLVATDQSEKLNGSRYNVQEAKAIADWLKENFSKIRQAYGDENTANLVGVITPFKAQVSQIERHIKLAIGKEEAAWISVGTVHTFQGAERKVILFSSVYGGRESCSFIDQNKSMMNVAVSRAKDCFLVFGDTQCMKESAGTSSGLMRRYIGEDFI